MKKLFFLSIIGLFIVSCNDDEAINTQTSEIFKKDNPDEFGKKKELLNKSLIKLYGNLYDSENDKRNGLPKAYRNEHNPSEVVLNGLSKEEIEAAISDAFPLSKNQTFNPNAPTIHGPFQVNGLPQIVRDNELLLWPGDGTGYPPIGNYVSDVIRYRGSYSTPPGALAGYIDTNATPPNGWGYLTDNNFSSTGRGPVYQSTTNPTNGQIHMAGNTYSVILIYNILGQTINAHKPFNAYDSGIYYKFYYIMP